MILKKDSTCIFDLAKSSSKLVVCLDLAGSKLELNFWEKILFKFFGKKNYLKFFFNFMILILLINVTGAKVVVVSANFF